MDKLEKALQKAREQRKVELSRQVTPPSAFDTFAGNTNAFSTPSYDSTAVDELHLEDRRIVAHLTPNKEADVFRILRTQILQIMNQNNFKTLAITSPNYGDGKTTIALNLATSIALDLKHTTLLVDLDLRKPNVHGYLGLTPEFGLRDYLVDNKPIPDCLQRLHFERLSILPAGQAHASSSELLGSPKMAALAQELKTRYSDRLVIYDMPPVLAQDDLIAFLPHVDAVLVVVNQGVTRVDDFKHCMSRLASANVIGTVLNNAGNPVHKERVNKMWAVFHKIKARFKR